MTNKYIKEIKSWGGVLLGCIVLASGFVYFINPYNIVPGGVYGASIVLHNLFPSIQVGTFGYMFDIPLLILSVLLLGTSLGAKTVAAALITPLIMNTMSMVSYPSKEALKNLDPSQLLGGCIDLSGELILAVLIGAALIGMGSGIVVKAGATSGGTDIIAMLLQKYAHIRFSNAILMADGAVVLFALVVFSLEDGGSSVILCLYSLIAIYVSSRMVARVLSGSKDDKMFFIISDKPLEQLHDFILNKLERTATIVKCSGLYTKDDKEMIFIVVSYKEMQKVKGQIKEADPRAFVIVTDAYDTYGEGWKQLPNPGDLQPE